MFDFQISCVWVSFLRSVHPTTSQFVSICYSLLLPRRFVSDSLRRNQLYLGIIYTWWGCLRCCVGVPSDLFDFEYETRPSVKETTLEFAILVAHSVFSGNLSVLVFSHFESVSSRFEQCFSLLTERKRLWRSIVFSFKECRYLSKEFIIYQQVIMNDAKAETNLKPSDEALSFLRRRRSESLLNSTNIELGSLVTALLIQ